MKRLNRLNSAGSLLKNLFGFWASLSTCLWGGVVAAVFLTGCHPDKPASEFMPDMYESTSFKAQKEDPFSKDGAAARVPPEGTVPRDFEPYHYALNEGAKAGQELKNPLLMTKANMDRGQKIFNTYCIVCHGPKGVGLGYVVPPFPRPPSLYSDKVVGWKDGQIYHTITKGQANMPSYATQIQPEDRWAVILYVRAIQRAAHPTTDELNHMKEAAAK